MGQMVTYGKIPLSFAGQHRAGSNPAFGARKRAQARNLHHGWIAAAAGPIAARTTTLASLQSRCRPGPAPAATQPRPIAHLRG